MCMRHNIFITLIILYTIYTGSLEISTLDQSNSELIRSTVMDTLKQRFRPEFLNRIDEFVTFKPLGMCIHMSIYTYMSVCCCVEVRVYMYEYMMLYRCLYDGV